MPDIPRSTGPRIGIRGRRATVATICLALAAGLASCAPADAPDAPSYAPGSSQSVADACAELRSSVAEATAGLQELDPADPAASIAALTGVADDLKDAASAIHNADVAAVLPPLQTGFDDAAQALQKIAGGDLSQVPALQQATSDIQDALAGFTDLCGAP